MKASWARRKFQDWPDDAVNLPTDEIVKLYTNGFTGAQYNPEAWEEFKALHPAAEDICHYYGLAESGAGKLSAPFVFVLEQYPTAWPGAVGQGTGDCVSWSQRNAMLGTLVTDVVAGIPDAKTGKVEGFPEVSAEGAAHGVLSTEVLYAYRGHSGQGWYCPGAAKIATSTCGMVLRQNHPDIGMDLTTYNVRNATKYGSSRPPESFAKLGGQRLVHEATSASSAEAVRDLIANGYAISGCGGEGFSESRDENGVAKRSGSWAHAMAQIGFDDRDVVKQKYGGPLVLILNSWAKWNRGPRDIIESAALVPANKKQAWIDKGIVNAATGNIMIPEGSFWAKWSDVSRREHIAMSGVNGWPRKELTWEEVFI